VTPPAAHGGEKRFTRRRKKMNDRRRAVLGGDKGGGTKDRLWRGEFKTKGRLRIERKKRKSLEKKTAKGEICASECRGHGRPADSQQRRTKGTRKERERGAILPRSRF